MTVRYFTPNLSANSDHIELPSDEVTHAVRVMRIKVGDQVELFDGNGCYAAATVSEADRRKVLLSLDSEIIAKDRLPLRHVSLAVALPKPDRARSLIERLTEIGVARVDPIVTERVQRAPSEAALEKLRRTSLESCKQCGRNRLMQIGPCKKYDQWFDELPFGDRFVMHPSRSVTEPQPKNTSSDAGLERITTSTNRTTILVGPEGGFTELEINFAETNGFQRVDLGDRIYRIETAAIVSATLAIHQSIA